MSETKTAIYSTAPSVLLAVIGGSLILAGGIVSLAWSATMPYSANQMMCCDMMMGGMMHGGMAKWWLGNQFWFNVMHGLSLAAIASGLLVLFSGVMMYKKPQDSQLWGTLALIFSITGILGMGGFVIGTILGSIGGILGILKK